MKNWPYALWGGDGSDEGSEEGSDDDSSEEGESEESVTMTQSVLESTIARAVSRATRKAKKGFRTELGFESQEDLDAWVTTTRETEEAGRDEAEKLKLENETAQAGLVSDRKAVLEDRVGLAIDRSIILAGITDEAKVKRIRTLVRSELVEVDAETLKDDVEEALEAVKVDVPSMFEAQSKKSFGGGDGEADDTKQTDEERQAAKEKQYSEEFARRGLIVTEK